MQGWILYKNDKRLKHSEEYEIERLSTEAKNEVINIRIIDVDKFQYILKADNQISYIYENTEIQLPDFVINRNGVLNNGDTLMLMYFLSKQNVYVFNGYESIQLTKDKNWMYFNLAINNFPIPDTMLINKISYETKFIKEFNYPIIYKQRKGTQGIGTLIFENYNRLLDFFNVKIFNKDFRVSILQEYINDKKGEVIRILVLNKEIISSYKKINKSDFKANAASGAKIEFIDLNFEMKSLALNLTSKFKIDFVGIDILELNNGKYLVCDVNSAPSFFISEKYQNFNVAKKIVEHIKRKV